MAVASSFANLRPSLLLDFANVGALDPRISFSRSTTGAHYDGVTTAKAEENLLPRSQEFDNAAWNLLGLTATSNTTTSPDGSITADTINEGTSTGLHHTQQVGFSYVSGTTYTQSVFAKADTATVVQMSMQSTAFGVNAFANYDLSSGVLGTVGASATATITSVGSGWYRITLTATATSTTTQNTGFIFLCDNNTAAARAPSYTGTSKQLFLWGAQFEQRSSVTAYTPTTTQPITNYIPVLQTAAAGQARFDHNPTTGEALGLLIEEQRTNLVTYSEQFDNAAWTKNNATVAANTVVAPDGTLTGEKLVENTANSSHYVHQSLTPANSTAYSFSCFAKAGERSVLWLGLGFSGGGRLGYNLLNGTVVAGTISTSSGSITPVGNGWYRCTLVVTTTSTAAGQIQVGCTNAADATTITYTGDGYSGIYIWGAQLEAGAFPTSYIPTTSAQVTRNADAASMTGANFSSWYNAGEGTMYGEVSARSALIFGRIADLTATDGNAGSIRAYYDTSVSPARIGWTTSVNSAQDFNVVPAVSVGETTARFAGVYANNSAQAAVNGIAGTEDTSCRVAQGINQLILGASVTGASRISGHIRKISYYPIRVTNAQLQALTS